VPAVAVEPTRPDNDPRYKPNISALDHEKITFICLMCDIYFYVYFSNKNYFEKFLSDIAITWLGRFVANKLGRFKNRKSFWIPKKCTVYYG